MDINVNTIIKIIEDSKKEADNVFMQKYGKQCRNVIEFSIEQFYDDYFPHIYDRQEGLLKAYKINTDATCELDASFIKGHHEVSNEYIYNLAFREGYHGGTKNGEGHPNPGTPYWRTPYPDFKYWGKPAVRTDSILSIIDKKKHEYDFTEKYKKILTDIISKNMTYLFGGVK